MVGLIALIVMGGINFFIQSDGLMWISSMLGVAVFIVFIAYDVNRIKNNVISYALHEDAGILDKIEIHGALSLLFGFCKFILIYIKNTWKKKIIN